LEICPNNICPEGVCVEDSDCEDGNLCTIDLCRDDNTCSNLQKSCDDGWGCSVDSCNQVDGSCVYESSLCECTNSSQCNDNNPCTTNTCSNGLCLTTNNTATCDDSNNCTLSDTCSNGICVGIPVTLDDGDVLTLDECLANGTVIHSILFNLSDYATGEDYDYDTNNNTNDYDTSNNTARQDSTPRVNYSNASGSSGTKNAQSSSIWYADDETLNVALISIVVIICIFLLGMIIFFILVTKRIPRKEGDKNGNTGANVPKNSPGPIGGLPRRPMYRMPPRG